MGGGRLGKRISPLGFESLLSAMRRFVGKVGGRDLGRTVGLGGGFCGAGETMGAGFRRALFRISFSKSPRVACLASLDRWISPWLLLRSLFTT